MTTEMYLLALSLHLAFLACFIYSAARMSCAYSTLAVLFLTTFALEFEFYREMMRLVGFDMPITEARLFQFRYVYYLLGACHREVIWYVERRFKTMFD